MIMIIIMMPRPLSKFLAACRCNNLVAFHSSTPFEAHNTYPLQPWKPYNK